MTDTIQDMVAHLRWKGDQQGDAVLKEAADEIDRLERELAEEGKMREQAVAAQVAYLRRAEKAESKLAEAKADDSRLKNGLVYVQENMEASGEGTEDAFDMIVHILKGGSADD